MAKTIYKNDWFPQDYHKEDGSIGEVKDTADISVCADGNVTVVLGTGSRKYSVEFELPVYVLAQLVHMYTWNNKFEPEVKAKT